MTAQEKTAIDNIRKAIKEAHKLGIRLAGMDSALLYATKSGFARGKKIVDDLESRRKDCYSAVAHACNSRVDDLDDSAGTIERECYEDSGGW